MSYQPLPNLWDDAVASKLDPVAQLIYRSNLLGSDQRVTNTGGSGGSVTNNPANPMANYASGDFDVKFRGVFAGYCPIVWGIKGMAMITYQSGLPYSATTAVDLNTDGAYTDYAPGFGGRNGQHQAASKSSSLRFTRAWKIGSKFEIEGNIDIFNVLNWANYSTNQYSAVKSDGVTPVVYGYRNWWVGRRGQGRQGLEGSGRLRMDRSKRQRVWARTGNSGSCCQECQEFEWCQEDRRLRAA